MKPRILPKNEWMNLFLLVCDVFLFSFRRILGQKKKTFQYHLTFNLFTPKSKVHTHVCFQLVALPVGRFWIWPCWDLVFNRTLLTHKPNWKFIVLLNMMLVRHLGHFIFHKMTWHAAFVANSHFVLIHKGRIIMILVFQAVNS